jgi:hypothetical protein
METTVSEDDPLNGRAPDRLRARVAHDLRPVRPLRNPWLRSVLIVPAAVLVFVGVPWVLGVRSDASTLGASFTWGLSALQVLAGLVLIGLALQEAVPGRALSKRVLAASIGAGLLLVLAVTATTFLLSPSSAPANLRLPYFVFCLRHSALVGAPVVLVAGFLAARALPLRPAVSGALYGFGGGLMTDAGWRLFCNVSAPSHVLTAHGGAILAMVGLGMAAATAGERVKRWTRT